MNLKKKILITGAGGLISNGTASYLKIKDKNIEVTGISRTERKRGNYDHIICSRFGERLKITDKKFELIIHSAFDKDDKSNEINTSGTKKWAQDAEKAGIKNQIFLSSISSQSEFLSSYGKSKKELEKWFLDRGHIVFRLGLVIADGGMFGRLLSSIKNSPIIPLISGGEFLVFPTDPETIYNLIHRISLGEVPDNCGEPLNLHFEKGSTLKDILRELSKSMNKKAVFLPVPYSLVYPIVKIASLIKLPGLNIDTGNLKGLKWNSKLSLRSDLKDLGYKEQNLTELINRL